MRLSVVVASEEAGNDAFAVFRGIKKGAECARRLGFDGIELSLRSHDEIAAPELASLLKINGLSLSAISTGQLFAARHLMFTEEDREKRRLLSEEFGRLIELAAGFGASVNIGRVRGVLAGRPKARCEQLFLDMLGPLAEKAEKLGENILLEPVNRSEINFINTASEGAALIKKSGIGNLKLMPDLYHMAAEGEDIPEVLRSCSSIITYVHIADSNRLYPGRGKTDFNAAFSALRESGFSGWFCAEVLPVPSAEKAAMEAEKFMRSAFQDTE